MENRIFLDSYLSNLDTLLILNDNSMGENYQRKRILVQKVFEKVKNETQRNTKNSIAEYLSTHFEERFSLSRDTATYARYHRRLIERNEDYNIDDLMLKHLSQYLGYQNFEDFCQNISIERERSDTTVRISINEDEESLSARLSNIFVTITNAPVFNLSEFFQNNKANMGITGIILAGSIIGGLIYGGKFEDPKDTEVRTSARILQKPCMYWNGDEYKITDCENKDPHITLEQIDSTQIKYFKRITKSDTLTPDNALGKIWYSKRWNKVEFFTATNVKGKNPKNGAILRPVTEMIIEKYAHKR
ncbi:TPA: hypothetical protein ACGZ99_000909 [Elizabethkingia anophelis]